MTPREYAKANRHIGEAWEEGKDIQFRRPEDGINEWVTWLFDFRPPFEKSNTEWRIKPEPPQPKYRCFYTTEIPVGAEARYKDNRSSVRHLLLCNSENGLWGQGTFVSFEDLLNEFEYKWPHEPETKWRPCGVEVKE
jgi:hypothetical protein